MRSATLGTLLLLSCHACSTNDSKSQTEEQGSAKGGQTADDENLGGQGAGSAEQGDDTDDTAPPRKALCPPDPDWTACEATDFSVEEIIDNEKWKISTWGSANRTHSVDNLSVIDGALELKVNGGTVPGETTTGAEITSARNDYLYGSFRMIAQGSAEPGTVFGWFYYLSDKSEIDIELLSKFDSAQTVHFTIHENIGASTHQAKDVGFSPSSGFHEYRFDWLKDRVNYYVDGELLVTLKENVPFEPGAILLNHWTLSSTAWGGGPPAKDAIAKVRSIEIYTNL